MGHKIFVSYKYADDDVRNLNEYENSTVRDYVDEFEKKINRTHHIYKGEKDGEDLSRLSDDEIWERLKSKIRDSSLTIVFISPNMKESGKSERDQWIPWEVSYSLKEIKRTNEQGQQVTSKTNAMLAVVLPDNNNSYNYYLESEHCCSNNCTCHHTEKLFTILRKNKFNKKDAKETSCSNNPNKTIYWGEVSYIEAVRWDDFIDDFNKYIDKAYDRQENIDAYDIYKEVL